MIFYLSSYANEDKLEFLEQTQSLIRIEYTELTIVHLIDIIKMELRNIDIDVMIIDINALFIENILDLKDVLEGFFILNPSSTVIILLQDEESHKEFDKFCYQDFFLVCYKNINFETDILNIVLKIKDTEDDNSYVVVPEHTSIDELMLESTEEISEVFEEITKDEDIIKLEDEKLSPVVIELDKILSKARRKKIIDSKPLQKVIKNIDYSKLMEDEINVMTDIDEAEVIKEVEPIQDTIEIEIVKETEWTCKNIMIGIIGTSNNVGTTTSALQIALLLDSMGANVTLTSIKDETELYQECHFNQEDEDNIFKCNNITFYSNSQFDLSKDDNFIIFDLGYYKEYDMTYKILNEMCSMVFVVAYNRVSEMVELKMALGFLDKIESSIIFNLASSVNKNIVDNLKQYKIHSIDNLSYIDCNYKLNWSCNDELTNSFLKFNTII